MADGFTAVVVIYNPNSTGPGKTMAQTFKRQLTPYNVQLVGTKYAGHAQKLAYKHAKASSRPLIISASGDGGYHEVVNGIIKAQKEGAHPTAGLLPAGNANDHYNHEHEANFIKAITGVKVKNVDLLKLTTTSTRKPFVRYAHSYIGFGLTPTVGNELNKVDLNWFNQAWIVLKGLFATHPITIAVDGATQSYESIICSNISKMSKVLSITKDARNDDGKFELTLFKRRSKWLLIKQLLKAVAGGVGDVQKTKTYTFTTTKSLLVQADGEVSTIDPHAEVAITIEPGLLRCIV